MRFGFVFPGGQPNEAVDAAVQAEASGWDGFFMWDPVWGVEPWVTLAAAAVRTDRIRIGTMLTPVSRCRPWKLAGETATLDRLSQGRVILSVGLGAIDTGFEAFGEETDRHVRAELLDEGLEIVTGLWRGQPFRFQGKHYHVRESSFLPPPAPIQQPRIPIWVVGAWPHPRSMRRVLRYDGLLPDVMSPDGRHRAATPDDIREMAAFVEAEGAGAGHFDVVVEGETPGEDVDRAAERIRPFAAAGGDLVARGDVVGNGHHVGPGDAGAHPRADRTGSARDVTAPPGTARAPARGARQGSATASRRSRER